jgi:hypothetical protein
MNYQLIVKVGIVTVICIELVIVLLLFLLSRNKEKWHNTIVKWSGKKYIINFMFPFYLTVALTLVLNIALYIIDIPEKYISKQSFFAVCVVINLLFTILTFLLGIHLQRLFVQALFSKAFIASMDSLARGYFIVNAFVVELYKQFATKPNFLTQHLKNHDFDNMTDLERNIQSASGVSLSTYLYSVLLKESLLQEPSIVYSVWNLNVVPISSKGDYAFYAKLLKDYYGSLNNDEKKRICVSNDINDITDEIKIQHREWGFDNIYWCSQSIFEDARIRLDLRLGFDDFVLYESGDNKWIIGVDKASTKTRICHTDEDVESMKQLFTSECIEQYYQKIPTNV